MVSSTASGVTPSSSLSGRSCTLWRRVGLATAFTSSGVTKVRPDSQAQAFETCPRSYALGRHLGIGDDREIRRFAGPVT